MDIEDFRIWVEFGDYYRLPSERFYGSQPSCRPSTEDIGDTAEMLANILELYGQD